MYKGLGIFVDSLAELQEANIQHLSIRISSSEFAFYLGIYRPPYVVLTTETSRYARKHTGTPRGPIFLLDFIRFQCSSSTQYKYKQGRGFRHLGVMLVVAKDIRSSQSRTVILKVRQLATARQLRNIQDKGDNLVNNIVLEPLVNKEVFLLRDNRHVYFVLLSLVNPIDFQLYAYYDFQGTVAEIDLLLPELPTRPFDIVLRRIVYTKANLLEVRPIQKQYLIRGELEIKHFSRQAIIDRFLRKDSIKVIVVLMLNFIDDFGLYRNMYRALIGFYIQNRAFTILERKRRTNVFPLTIGPYSSNLEGVIQAIGSFLV